MASQLAAAGELTIDDDDMTMTELPGIDLILGIPTEIVAVIRSLPLDGPVAPDQLTAAGARLIESFSSRKALSPMSVPEVEREAGVGALGQRSHTGGDGIYVELGRTWF